MSTHNLLVELLVEELPPKALKKLGESFAAVFAESLKSQGLAGAEAVATPFASPRRLAVHVTHVASQAADKTVQHKLMPAAVGLDATGQPSPALLKKLLGLGVGSEAVAALKRQGEGKNETLFLDTVVTGAALDEGVQKALDLALAGLPVPKRMTYQLDDGWTSVNFVRPAHGLVALHGSAVVRCYALGLHADRSTQGHRFESAQAHLSVHSADSYEQQLRDEGAVIAGFAQRRAEIVRQLQAAASTQGLQPSADDALLDEVTALVERPNVLLCQFEPEFLEVPQECLILTMKANQKYFPLLDAAGRLTHQFLVVSNIRPANPSRVIEGNERVVRPRLADAKFFFDQDRKKTLASRVSGLAKVVYHNQLGTQGARIERVGTLAAAIGRQLGGAPLAESASRAALLAKADLLTGMVGEFPELQGIMGGYYARHDGETDEVAHAVEDHYKPRFAGDTLPRGATGIAVALADKLETLAGLFGIGQIPTGDKDPFALRRQALGVIRMLIERELPLDVHRLIADAFQAFPPSHGQAQAEVGVFLRERLSGYLRESGYTTQEVDAVVAACPARWADLPKHLAAVRAFVALPEAASLAAANKRVGNILKKSEAGSEAAINPALLKEAAEIALVESLTTVQRQANAAFERGDYTASLLALAALKTPVDAFFDSVMVNADDPALRANRLGLLAMLHAAMNRVADLSKLAS